MTWPVPFDTRISLNVQGRVSTEDATRQAKTAQEILERLARQPGIILADEVGMGKTFVALAVAASAALADKGGNPVVVMVPPSLKEKWPRDFNVFTRHCFHQAAGGRERKITEATAHDGVSFLKLLDDPASRRPRIIFLSHGALSRGLVDPWTKLAILKAALRSRRLDDQRKAFHRFAAEILRVASRYDDENLFRELLSHEVHEWRALIPECDDDPVPESIANVLKKGKIDLGQLVEALRDLPLRDSPYRNERVTQIRRNLTAPLRQVWFAAITESQFSSPLLILDEAHHLKNPATALASLFVTEEAQEDVNELQGALEGRFERMLFLTATPFQLGHHELLKVLSRFRGIRWKSSQMTPEEFDSRIEQLSASLDRAQHAALALEERWGTLRPEDLPTQGPDHDGDWWAVASANAPSQSERLQSVMRLVDAAVAEMRAAEKHLQPWVIRHLRKRHFETSGKRRRMVLPGGAIIENGSEREGLAIGSDALLPFLLVARSQAVATSAQFGHLAQGVRRLTFVEGLASSFEAYRETRAALDGGQTIEDLFDEDRPDDNEAEADRVLKRYIAALNEALPGESAHSRHPKIAATVARVVRLWRNLEKVLVFCHFRATGRALENHIRQAINREIMAQAAKAFACDTDKARVRLRSINEAFDPGRPAGRHLAAEVASMVDGVRSFSDEDRKAIGDIIRRFVRTDSFLVRYFPLDERDPVERLKLALDTPDDSGLSLRRKFEQFVEFLSSREGEERREYLKALRQVQTEHNVRRATGETQGEQRKALLLAFNTPFFPEVLVASSVLAEGVDLHLDCRHVIHHDLSWNPSTLEQRTGRVDRIGAKSERVTQPIQVFLPYIGGTQDEKMYRVVRDRERWFQVIMGDDFQMDERRKDKIAERIPLPETAAKMLAFRLNVV